MNDRIIPFPAERNLRFRSPRYTRLRSVRWRIEDDKMKEVIKYNATKVPKRYYYPLIGDYREFACGWGAAMVNITITFPVNKLIFRQMLHGINVRAAFVQLMNEGVTSVYRGILPPLLQKSISSSLMFGTYDMFKKPLVANQFNPYAASTVAAMMAGTVEAVFAPFERVQTLLQDSAYQKDFVNMKHVVKVISLQYGFKEFYRGLTPILYRNGPSNVVYFISREKFGELLVDNRPSKYRGVVFLKQFLIGACIGAVNSTLFYPLGVIKVHMQSRLGGSYISIWKAAKEIYVERGCKMRNFYKGVHMNYTRSFVSWGLVNLAYERLKKAFVTVE